MPSPPTFFSNDGNVVWLSLGLVVVLWIGGAWVVSRKPTWTKVTTRVATGVGIAGILTMIVLNATAPNPNAPAPQVQYWICGDKTTAVTSGDCYARSQQTINANLPQRVGAVCTDGSQSGATGQGACSYHGGVARWLFDRPYPTAAASPLAVFAPAGRDSLVVAATAYQTLQADTDGRVVAFYQQLQGATDLATQQLLYSDIAGVVGDALSQEHNIAYPESMSDDASKLIAAAQEEEDAFNAAAASKNPASLTGRIQASVSDYIAAVAPIRKDLGLPPVAPP